MTKQQFQEMSEHLDNHPIEKKYVLDVPISKDKSAPISKPLATLADFFPADIKIDDV